MLYTAPVLSSGGIIVEPDGQSEHQLTPRRFSVLLILLSGSSQMLYSDSVAGIGTPVTLKPPSSKPLTICF